MSDLATCDMQAIDKDYPTSLFNINDLLYGAQLQSVMNLLDYKRKKEKSENKSGKTNLGEGNYVCILSNVSNVILEAEHFRMRLSLCLQ